MSKSTQKRRGRLEHFKKDHETRVKTIEDIDKKSGLKSGIIPKDLREELEKIGRRIANAEEYIDLPEGEDLVHGVTSASDVIAISFELSGMKAASGGWQSSKSATRQLDWKEWASLAHIFAREIVASEKPKPLPYGWKMCISKKVAKKCKAPVETVRGRLYEMGVFKEISKQYEPDPS